MTFQTHKIFHKNPQKQILLYRIWESLENIIKVKYVLFNQFLLCESVRVCLFSCCCFFLVVALLLLFFFLMCIKRPNNYWWTLTFKALSKIVVGDIMFPPIFQKTIRLGISCESSADRQFTCNIKPYFLWTSPKKNIICLSCDQRFKE